MKKAYISPRIDLTVIKSEEIMDINGLDTVQSSIKDKVPVGSISYKS